MLESSDGAEQADLELALVRARVCRELFGISHDPVRLGRFELLRWVGSGSTGNVYEARDVERGGYVALKSLARMDARGLSRFKAEFRSLVDVVHPNVVALKELFVEELRWFFSMELLNGVTFQRWVRHDEVFDEPRLRDALSQLVQGVSAIHRAGKLHRDLKPSNVLVTVDGRVVVLDFGLVSDISLDSDAQACTTGMVGTIPYVAPEQADGAPASTASDWYALGVMLFEALTGTLPFTGNEFSVLDQKRRHEAPDPRQWTRELPNDLCDLCMGLLARDALRRFGLEDVLRVVPTRQPATSPIEECAPVASSAVFVGRERELSILSRALTTVQGGRPASVLVSGRSGMGKSALLARFANLGNDDTLILQGRCHEHESVPYKVFDTMMDALSRYLRRQPSSYTQRVLPRHASALLRLFPVLREVDAFAQAARDRHLPATDREQRTKGFIALKELLLRLTDHAPVVLIVDDLQWGDSDSARMLGYVLGPPEPPPLLFVGAFRSEEASSSEFLLQLLTERTQGDLRFDQLELGPLECAEAIELARTLLGVDGSSSAVALANEAQGIPFFITQLAQHVSDRNRMGTRSTDAHQLSLEQVILERVARLSERARRLLRVLSLAAGPLELNVAAHAADLDVLDSTEIRELRAARLIRTHPAASFASAELYHDRLRETVVAGLGATLLRETHAALATAMEQCGICDPERLLLHYNGSQELERAGEAAAEAAQLAAQKLAFNRAAELYRSAIQFLGEEQSQSRRLYSRLGDALANAGQGALSAEAYLRAADGLIGADARVAQRLAAQQYLRSGRIEDGTRLARVLLETVGVSLPSTQSAALRQLIWERVRLRIRGLHVRENPPLLNASTRERLETLEAVFQELRVADTLGALFQTMYLREALDSGERTHVVRGLVWEVFNRALLGGPANERQAKLLSDKLQQIAGHSDSAYLRGMSCFAEGTRLLWTGRRFRDAGASLLAAKEILSSQCPGTFWECSMAHSLAEICLEFTGSPRQLVAAVADMQRDADERDDRYLALMMLLATPYARLVGDDAAGAKRLLDEHAAWVEGSYSSFRHRWVLRQMETAIFLGTAHQALALVQKEWPAFRRSYLHRCEFVRDGWHYFHARCATAAYAEKKDPAHRELAAKAIAPLRHSGGAYGAHYSLLAGSLYAADGQKAQAVAAVQRGRDLLVAAESDILALYAERRLAALLDDVTTVASIDASLREQGVVNPQRWAWAHIPWVE